MTTIEKVFNNCHEQIFNHAIGVVKNFHDAEDIRNDVYVKIQRLRSSDYDESKGTELSSWVHTITNSVILDFFRYNKYQDKYKAVSDFVDKESKEFFEFVAPENSRADKLTLENELHDKIRKAFSSMKPKYRMIAKLYFLNDLPYTEIAELVDVPMGTVKGMLSRARAKLQEHLAESYQTTKV